VHLDCVAFQQSASIFSSAELRIVVDFNLSVLSRECGIPSQFLSFLSEFQEERTLFFFSSRVQYSSVGFARASFSFGARYDEIDVDKSLPAFSAPPFFRLSSSLPEFFQYHFALSSCQGQPPRLFLFLPLVLAFLSEATGVSDTLKAHAFL